jgi:putative transposase
MPNKRKIIFANDETYHIFNRTIANQSIFTTKREIERARDLIDFYRFAQKIRYSHFRLLSEDDKQNYFMSHKKELPLVNIISFCLMPNHFHFLIQQTQNNGIKIFTSNFQNAYAKYFNQKNKRNGSMFQSPFKGKWVENDEILLHISRYIHLNPVTSFIIEIDKLPFYPNTSYPYYMGNTEGDLISKDLIISLFGTKEKYHKFVLDQVDYQRNLKIIKEQTFN